MRVAIVQSCYIPWKGYFSLIDLADHFVLYDDVQYTRDWRNRNRIRTSTGAQWISIPIAAKGHRFQRVRDAQVIEPGWAERHWRTLRHHYRQAPHFSEIAPAFEEAYARAGEETHLSEINGRFLRLMAGMLKISTPLHWSMEFPLVEGRTARLVDLCRQLGADEYLTGPAARCYLDESLFAEAGIRVLWMEYSGYSEYSQVHGSPCLHQVTAIDLLMNLGIERAAAYMADFRALAEARLQVPSTIAASTAAASTNAASTAAGSPSASPPAMGPVAGRPQPGAPPEPSSSWQGDAV